MSFSVQTRIGGNNYQTEANTQKLNEIFGYQPTVNISSHVANMTFQNGNMVVLTGTFLEIIGGDKKYTVCPSQFSRQINSSEIKGDGLFEGPWDEAGKKIADLFFSKHSESAIIYLNDVKRRILKKEDGSVDLV
jgi:hypothetical protein